MRNILVFIICLTLFFSLCIVFDITPYLRGPAPYPPDWQWDYLFVNTYSRMWLPIAVSIISFLLYLKIEQKEKRMILKKEWKIILLFIFLSIAFQFALLYFNRAGIFVLLHRIINPDLNGYFSSSLSVDDLGIFLRNFNQNVLFLDQHAQGHPPFSVLFFWIINKFFLITPFLFELIEKVNPQREDVLIEWRELLPNEKLGALFSMIFIPFLTSLAIYPLHRISKKLYGIKVALRTGFSYIFIPGVVLFIPINDVFISLFPLFSLWIFIEAISKSSKVLFILSGLLFSVGLFFSLSLLPLLVVFVAYCIHTFWKQPKQIGSAGLFFGFGFLVIPIILSFVGFNSVQVLFTIMSGLPESRHYFPWVLYNLYDFLIFFGIGFGFVYFCMIGSFIKNRNLKKLDPVFLGTFIMLLVLDLSGSVRGEVGRIWIPFMPFLLLPIVNFVTAKKYLNFSRNEFFILISTQLALIIIINEYWVTLW